MNKISIVGVSGSGKSTLANKLGKKLDLPVFHLDKYFWTTGWKKRYPVKADFNALTESFALQDEWIIDGNYRDTLDMRFERADIIIFLDFPKWRCLWRVFIRIFNRKQPFDKAEGVKQKIDWELVKWIINYTNNETREKVLAYKNIKPIFIAKNNKQIREVFEGIIK